MDGVKGRESAREGCRGVAKLGVAYHNLTSSFAIWEWMGVVWRVNVVVERD